MAKRPFRMISPEESFYELLVKQAQILLQGVELLTDLVQQLRRVSSKARRLHDLEHEADEVTHEVMRRLNTTFVTPLDREDIHELASSLDDVMEPRGRRVRPAGPAQDRRAAPGDSGPSQAPGEGLPDELLGMRELPACDRLEALGVEINRLEHKGDWVFRQVIADLFGGLQRHGRPQVEGHNRRAGGRDGRDRGRGQHARRDRPEAGLVVSTPRCGVAGQVVGTWILTWPGCIVLGYVLGWELQAIF